MEVTDKKPRRRGPKPGTRHKPEIRHMKAETSLLTALMYLPDNTKVILPVPAHLTPQRYQPNVKAMQAKSGNAIYIETHVVYYFSKEAPEDGVSVGIECTITRTGLQIPDSGEAAQ